MLASCDKHDQFTPQIRNRLKTTSIALGLVRLLMDAGLTEEARTTLISLDTRFQGHAGEVAKINVFATDGPSVHQCPRN
jgi:hypothetical protein